MSIHDHLRLYRSLGLTAIPLKPRYKVPLVKWRDGWNPSPKELERFACDPSVNWGVRCGENLVIDCDSADAFRSFTATHGLPPGCPVVKTGRGYHIWVKPKKPVSSQRLGNVEIKCLGSYIVAPPSIHPSGAPYVFEVAPDGSLPEVDLEALLGMPGAAGSQDGTVAPQPSVPSDFALRYGKSQYPEALCGQATMILTSPDGRIKKLLSLRCWKWHCPKCAPLLRRYWHQKLEGLQFRFILRVLNVDKPRRFLRNLGKPRYVHIVANGEGWLFLLDGDLEQVCSLPSNLHSSW